MINSILLYEMFNPRLPHKACKHIEVNGDFKLGKIIDGCAKSV